MSRQPLSLKVLAAYARDTGTGVVRIDQRTMDFLGVATGDTVEVIGNKDGMDVKCYPLLPSDENQSITRIDPAVREKIGVSIDDTVTIRNLVPVPFENLEKEQVAEKTENAEEYAVTPQEDGKSATLGKEQDEPAPYAAPQMFALSGSCIDFEKERAKLVAFIDTLESAAHSKSHYKCYSDGKKALGWDFFLLEIDEKFVEKVRDIYPDMDKQEADTPEQRFALWMNKQLKKTKLDFHLKLSDVQQEKVTGFRLDPEYYRNKTDLEDLK